MIIPVTIGKAGESAFAYIVANFSNYDYKLHVFKWRNSFGSRRRGNCTGAVCL